MIRDFENWNNALSEVSQLEELKNVRVGIDAADYIYTRILNRQTGKEPLLPALGGLPLSMRTNVEDDLAKFSEFGIHPLFVFSGLNVIKPENPFRARQEGVSVNIAAWNLYDNHQAEDSVLKFGQSTYVAAEDLFCGLQSILVEKKLPFQVAPYSAWAQLAYLAKHNFVQAISGASETLLFDCDKVITSWEFENNTFKWIKRNRCVADLKKYISNGDISDDMFVDACMLAGNHFLPTLPTLDAMSPPRSKAVKPLGAIEMMMANGRSGISLVLNNQDDPRFKRSDYVDKFRRARLAVKHHPILTHEGKILPLLDSQIPNDAHEFIGQRLPDEIYHYLSRGLINARLLNWRATCEVLEGPPVDGGESAEYQNLVGNKLTPLRSTTINLLTSSLHNWYQHKDLTVKCWFIDSSGKPKTSTISTKGSPEVRRIVEKWNVREATFRDTVSKHQPSGYLASALLSLTDANFASKTVTDRNAEDPLSTTDEVIYNSIWRFFSLREYVDAGHQLTAWGKVVAAILPAVKGNTELEEATFLAVELLRLGVLNGDNMFNYNGAPMRGDQKDQTLNLLISRVAGLGVLHHKAIGFTGPLSHHLLGYNSMVNAVRITLRDMIEVSATQLFTGGFAKRDIDNLPEISMALPFLLPNNCALSIAVKSYLDELLTQPDQTSAETKAFVKSNTMAARYFPQSENYVADLHRGFELWDAIYGAVKSAGRLVSEKDKKIWNEANEWLSPKR